MSETLMYGTFIMGYSVYGLPLPSKMKKGILFMVTAFICVDIALFDYSVLQNWADLLQLTIYPLLLVLFGLLIYREYNPKLDNELRSVGGVKQE